MRNTVWKFKEKIDDTLAYQISRELNIDPYLVKLIYARGLKDKEEIKKFLTASLEDISNPFELKDMDKAVIRIEKAIKDKEKIFIYGDYDVDGTCATSLFILAFKELGVDIEYYIPNRNEGYGINKVALQKVKNLGCNLVITVDCGITAFEEIEFANSIGLDVIVTDHHTISYSLPKAFAVINPQRSDNVYKFKYLAGVGTAFMVLYALFKTLNEDLENLFQFLDLVAIGTTADVMPLTNENRIFVKYGLEKLKRSSILGLRTLTKNILKEDENITTTHIGFKIAPLFNAAGRLESADSVVNLLICSEKEKCEQLCNYLFNLNKERQNLGKEILEKVEEEITQKNLKDKKIIICANENYHQGLIGIISARVATKYQKPSIVLSIKEDGTAVGSARSFNNINIVEALEKAKELLIKFGGHKQAGGLTIRKENIEKFDEILNSYIETLNTKIEHVIEIDGDIEEFRVTLEFFDNFKILMPFGNGNEEPLFSLRNVKLEELRLIGKAEDHLMFHIVTNNLKLKNCVWFGSKDYHVHLNEKEYYDIAIRIDENIFKGKRYTKVYVEDIKPSKNTKNENSIHTYYKELYNISFPIKTEFYLSDSLLNEGDELEIEREIYSNFVPLWFKGEIIGSLRSEVSYILKELNKNFHFRFKAKVEKIKKIEDIYEIKIEISKCYEIRNQDKENKKALVNEIKNLLIGSSEYNSIQKNVLRKIIFEDKNILLVSKRGRGIKTLALSIAMYYYALTNRKSLYITSIKNIPEIIKEYFEVLESIKDINYENYPFAFFDDIKNENCSIKNLYFTENSIDDQSREIIIDNINLPTNLDIVDEENEETYTRELNLVVKKSFIEDLRSGKKIKAKREIIALLEENL